MPIVLAVLRRRLADAGGLASEGIFRIAPDDATTRTLKQALDRQRWDARADDMNSYAHLIKVRTS